MIHALQQNVRQQGYTANDPGDDASGYPGIPDWPKWNDITHQRMWVEWIRRAYQGGLRVMVALATNNKTLGDLTAGPGDYPTDDKASRDLQIDDIRSFVGQPRQQCQLNSRLHRPVIKWLSFGSRPPQKKFRSPRRKCRQILAAKPVLKPARYRKAPGRPTARNLPGRHSAITNGSCYGCRRKLWP